MRRAARNDNNQGDIVKALRRIPGVSVECGHDDILVGLAGRTWWFEIKDPSAISVKTGKPKKGEITKAEQKRLETFTGHYRIVSSLDEILDDIL